MFERNHNLRNRMRETRSSGSVGERGGNKPLYPEFLNYEVKKRRMNKFDLPACRTGREERLIEFSVLIIHIVNQTPCP